MAQASSKATRDDDIFDSEAMSSYRARESAIDGDLFEDLRLFDPSQRTGSAALSSGVGNKRKGGDGSDEEELEFGGSHVHKLHYRPPSKLFAPAKAANSETNKKSTVAKLVDAKTGKINLNVVTKQVNAAVLGVKTAARGGRSQSDSSEEDSSDLDSDDDEEDDA